MSVLFAYVHHIAAFGLFAALVVEFVLLRQELTAKSARAIILADLCFGVAAGLVLLAGVVRVFFLEKGPDYYLSNSAFIAKAALFVVVGLLSIYPTVQFLSWRRSVQSGQAPTVSAAKMRSIRSVIHVELAGVALLILFAALMARGIG